MLRFRCRYTMAGQAGGPGPGLLSCCPFAGPEFGGVCFVGATPVVRRSARKGASPSYSRSSPGSINFKLALDFFNQHFLRAHNPVLAGNGIPARPKATFERAGAKVAA